MKIFLLAALTLVTAASPAFGESRPRTLSTHVRQQTFHDRTPRVHERNSQFRRGA